LLKALVPPPLPLPSDAANAFGSVNVPLLLRVPFESVIELFAAVLPLQLVGPFRFRIRPAVSVLVTVPVIVSALSYSVVPVPVCVPTVQVDGPVTVSVPVPPMMPPP